MRMQLRDYVENPQILIEVPQLGTLEYLVASNASAEITANAAGIKIVQNILREATQNAGVDLFEINLGETPIGFIFDEEVSAIKNGIATLASYSQMSDAIILLTGLTAAEQDMKKFIYTELEERGNRILSLTLDSNVKNFRERDYGVTINEVYRAS